MKLRIPSPMRRQGNRLKPGLQQGMMKLQTPIPMRLPVWAAVAVGLLIPSLAIACSVPVFRYAIEHWRPDAYQVFVYHDEDLTSEQQATAQALTGRDAEAAGVNAEVRFIDLREENDPVDVRRYEAAGKGSLPQMVVNLPRGIAGGDVAVASGPWETEEVARLVRSPARTEVGERLVQGEVVWVFIDGEDAEASDKAFKNLETSLAGLEETLELPAIDQDDLDELSVDAEDLAIRFSTVRISREDPAEKWFIEMLLSIEPDLRDEDFAGQPMVVPVFGRGRALYALVGAGINNDMLKEAAEFLTGACQCTVKAENPGVDLLMPVRWDDYIVPTEPEEVTLPLVGLGNYAPEASADEDAEPAMEVESERLAAVAESAADDSPETAINGDSPLTTASLVADTAAPRSPVTFWLPWVVVLLITAAAGLAGLSFFRRS